MKTAEEIIRTYITKNILYRDDGYPYPDEASFLDNGIVDSMNMLEIVMFIEETFSLSVDDTDIILENFDSVNKLAAFLRRKNPGIQ